MKMAWNKTQKTFAVGAAALAALCVLQSRRRHAEHNASSGALDADLKPPVRRAVLSALSSEHDPNVLHQLAGKLEAAGFSRSAEVVGARALEISGGGPGAFLAGAPTMARASVVGHGTANVVSSAQQKLNMLGWDVEIDGVIGPRTRRAIMEFQSLHDLNIDGIIGPETSAALDAAVRIH
jgi:hypothetical protein